MDNATIEHLQIIIQTINKTAQQELEKVYKEVEKLQKSMNQLDAQSKKTSTAITKSFASAEAKAKNLSKSVMDIGWKLRNVGVLLATFGVANTFKEAYQSAKNTNAMMTQLNSTLGASANEFKLWAETTAESFGLSFANATKYGNKFASFTQQFASNSNQALDLTQAMLQQVAVIASSTGRTIEDVATRVTSGLLGETEAIEDIGIYMTQAMLKTTQAFQILAGDSSWTQLSFQQQTQIRYLAILEQSYLRYGTSLNPAMQANLQFTAQLQNLQYQLGQAFYPILNAVIPILSTLISWISTAMAYVSAFFQLLFGTPASGGTISNVASEAEQANQSLFGASQGAEALEDASQGASKALDDADKKAQDIKRSLAGFDEINVLNEKGGGATTGGAGSSGIGGAGGGGGVGGLELPDFGQAGEYLTQFQQKVEAIKERMKELMPLLKAIAIAIGVAFAVTGIVNFASFLMGTTTPALMALRSMFIMIGNTILTQTGLMTAFASVPMAGLVVGITSVVTGLLGLGVIIVDLIRNGSMFKESLKVAFEVIGNTISIVYNNFIKPFLEGFAEGFMVAYKIIRTVVDVILTLATTIGTILFGALNVILEAFGLTVDGGGAVAGVMENIGVVVGILTGLFLAYIGVLGLVKMAMFLYTAVTTVASGVSAILAGAIAFITSPVFLVIGAIALLIGAVYLLAKNWDWISGKAIEIWEGIKETISNVIDFISNFISTVWEGIKEMTASTWEYIKLAITNPLQALKNLATNILTALKTFISGIWDFLKNSTSNAWNLIKGFMTNPIQAGKDFIINTLNSFKSFVTNIWNAIGNIFGLSDLGEKMMKPFRTAIDWISNKVEWLSNIIQRFVDKVTSGFQWIGDKISGIFGGGGGRSLTITSNPMPNPEAEIPALASGGIAYGRTSAIVGEYAGASANPEVIAPLDKLTDIIVNALSNVENQERDLYVNLSVGETQLAKAVIKGINNYTAQTGRKVLKL